MNNPLDALFAGLTKKATTVATPDHVVEIAVRAMQIHNPRGGQSEIFRILHVVLEEEKASIVKVFSKYIQGFRPQAVYNTLRSIPPHVRQDLLRTYAWVPGRVREVEQAMKEAAEAEAKAKAKAEAEQEDSNES